jgi:aspirochlorine biosynthesis cytochrome P450 monooxygenase
LQRYTTLFISRLREESSREGKVDFVYWINALTTDIIGELAFGQSFSGLESGKTHPWLHAVFGGIKIGFLAGELPFWMVKFAIWCLPDKIRKHYDKVRLYGADAVQRRMNMGTDRPDLFSSLLTNRNQGKISDSEIIEIAVAFIVGGSETTATLLSACLYLLCRNPDRMQKITNMIRSEFASNSDLTLRNLKGHEYLNAVLQEALRLYPPAPDSLFRRTHEPAVVVGELIPPNTSLTINLWAANRSSRNFHRPEEFLPERWLKDCPPKFSSDDRAVAKPFSFGPRDCVGKR